MEKACFLKGLQFLKEKPINVVEVITDAHTQMAYLMSKSFLKKKFEHALKNIIMIVNPCIRTVTK